MFFNNAYYVLNVSTAAESARALGKTEDAAKWEAQAEKQRKAAHAAFYDPMREVYVNGEQSYQAIALLSGIAPREIRTALDERLSLLITEARKNRLNTGVLGTYFMFRYLLQKGRNDLIYQMVNQRTYLGWGWLLENGATTVPGQWGGTWSQIHTSFLSVNSWFIEGLAGIQLDEQSPGYQHIVIKPAVVGDLEWVKCSYQSVCGRIISNWRRGGGKLRLEVTIPLNTAATIHVPAPDPAAVTESGRAGGEGEV